MNTWIVGRRPIGLLEHGSEGLEEKVRLDIPFRLHAGVTEHLYLRRNFCSKHISSLDRSGRRSKESRILHGSQSRRYSLA